METLAAALALILVIEGVTYALFPAGMKRMLAGVMRMSDSALRNIGLIAAAVGLGVLYLLYR
jgi:uncharacterized protein